MPDSSQVATHALFGGGRMRRLLSLLLAAVLLAAAVALAGLTSAGADSASAAAGDGCSNSAFRNGPSASLPDCRAYEMVSPVEKNGGDIATACDNRCNRTSLMQGAPDGSKLSYSSYKSFGDAPSSLYSNQYIATRSPAGWSTHSINPPRHETLYSGFPNFVENFYDLNIEAKGFSTDLSTMAWTDDSRPTLTPDAAEEVPNLYSRDNLTDSYHWIAQLGFTSEGTDPGFQLEPEVMGLSEDGGHVVFGTSVQLTPDALPTGESEQLYDYSGGEVHLVSLLPNDTAAAGVAGSRNIGNNEINTRRLVRNSISRDGSRITWSNGTGVIYQRIDNAETEKVSEVVGTGAAQYWDASADGTEVLLSRGEGGNAGLYKVNVDNQTSTPIATDIEGVVGASDTLSRIYFVSPEALATGASVGAPNLYLFEGGTIKLIGTLSPIDVGGAPLNEEGNPAVAGYNVTALSPRNQAARVTPDGLGLAFQSVASLTGYDNRDVKNNEPDVEVFVYDAATEELHCASCNPSGARPNGKPLRHYNKGGEPQVGEGVGTARRWTAAFLQTVESQTYYPRDLSDSGDRVFFNAYDSLSLEDNNSQQDVYEWEAQGTGSCTQPEGCISLISTGESPAKSEFVDASADGSSVFFTTKSSLSPADPGLIDLYNAKEGGGYPPPPTPAAPCEGDACQSLPVAPNDPTPASASYNGQGNVQQKTKKKHHKKHHKKRHRKHHNKSGPTNSRHARSTTHGNG
jgi:hypothetical protein